MCRSFSPFAGSKFTGSLQIPSGEYQNRRRILINNPLQNTSFLRNTGVGRDNLDSLFLYPLLKVWGLFKIKFSPSLVLTGDPNVPVG